jgi:protein SCO1/2
MKKRNIVFSILFILLLTGVYIFSRYEFPSTDQGLPVISERLHPFSFINQDGKNFTEKDLDGKVFVAEFFFTTCPGICPKMNVNMRRIYDIYKNEKNFMILSHTSMPETDSVPVLKKYERRMLCGTIIENPGKPYTFNYDTSANCSYQNSNWQFLTGDKKELYAMARFSYDIADPKDDTLKIEDQFVHTQHFALVDKQGRLRCIYDGLQEKEIQKLIKDIRDLLLENSK